MSLSALLRSNIPRLKTSILSPIPAICNFAHPICTTLVNYAEPLKKKKRIDPSIIRAREVRKQKKVEKQIRRLEKMGKQLKPIDECEIPIQIIEEGSRRRRKVSQMSSEVAEEQWYLLKEWSNYSKKLYRAEETKFNMMLGSQQRALDELRIESEELYQSAISLDDTLTSFETKGPVETPPIKDYDFPNGDTYNISKNWYERQW